jgi:hypothetical protein
MYELPDPSQTAPRVTSWGIEVRGDAQRLYIRGLPWAQQARVAIWALPLVTVNYFGAGYLPYVLVLAQDGALSSQYRRLVCYQFPETDSMTERLGRLFDLGDVVSNKLFHLRYDADHF